MNRRNSDPPATDAPCAHGASPATIASERVTRHAHHAKEKDATGMPRRSTNVPTSSI